MQFENQIGQCFALSYPFLLVFDYLFAMIIQNVTNQDTIMLFVNLSHCKFTVGKMNENSTNLYKKLEKEASDLVIFFHEKIGKMENISPSQSFSNSHKN